MARHPQEPSGTPAPAACPHTSGNHRIGSSVTELSWLDAVPGDTPVCVIAEGLMMYLPERDGTALLRRITEQFPSGQLMFDGYSGGMTRLVSRLATVRGAKVELVWGVDDPRDLEKQVPQLRLAEDVPFLTMPELVGRLATNGFSRAMHGFMGRLPFYRHLVRHLRYEF
jgi:O-methyltransferase involved in polyketide biosynthesis